MAYTEFEIACSLMSGAADNRIRSDKNDYPIPAGYHSFLSIHDKKSELDVTCFKNGSNIVIAFGSTSGATDAATDLRLGAGVADLQLLQAAELYMKIGGIRGT